MSNKVEKWTLEDGRKAEKRVHETVNTSELTSEKVVELHMEDERPLKLKQRVIEKTKPVIYERKIETLDAHGNVVEVKVESSEPKVQMQLVEHIAVGTTMAAHGCKAACKKQASLTKEDLAEAIAQAIKSANPKDECKVKSLGIASKIAEQVEGESKSDNTVNNILIGVIVVLTIGLGYMLFAM